jgi:hypothetical protein
VPVSRRGRVPGRTVTYELMAGYWPTADQDPGASAPVIEFSRIWRDMPKLVFSRTLEQAGWNTTIGYECMKCVENAVPPGKNPPVEIWTVRLLFTRWNV